MLKITIDESKGDDLAWKLSDECTVESNAHRITHSVNGMEDG